MGRVQFGPLIKEINLAFVPEAEQGDHVIVHAGFAIAVLTQEEALPIYDTYRERVEQG
jgi:hydrogenase expression/formation protein HypC